MGAGFYWPVCSRTRISAGFAWLSEFDSDSNIDAERLSEIPLATSGWGRGGSASLHRAAFAIAMLQVPDVAVRLPHDLREQSIGTKIVTLLSFCFFFLLLLLLSFCLEIPGALVTFLGPDRREADKVPRGDGNFTGGPKTPIIIARREYRRAPRCATVYR